MYLTVVVMVVIATRIVRMMILKGMIVYGIHIRQIKLYLRESTVMYKYMFKEKRKLEILMFLLPNLLQHHLIKVTLLHCLHCLIYTFPLLIENVFVRVHNIPLQIVCLMIVSHSKAKLFLFLCLLFLFLAMF